jgi:hypothetical protein
MEDVIEIKATSNTKVNPAKDIKDGLKDANQIDAGKRPIVLAHDFLKKLEDQ